jgi:GTP-binding protein
VDIAPIDETDPADSARVIQKELEKYSDAILDKPRWLVLNKTDLLLEEEGNALCDRIVADLDWQGPVYRISAINRQGTDHLVKDIAFALEQNKQQLEDEAYEKYSAEEAQRVRDRQARQESLSDQNEGEVDA